MASETGTGGAESDAVVDPSDPGARLLIRIGDFIEPLTRFDRSHLSMAESRQETIPVMARQVFRVVFDILYSNGNGALPQGVESVADKAALERGAGEQLGSARALAPARLAAWAEAHGEDPMARPAVEDCFSKPAPLGFAADCVACLGAGKVACSVCKGAKELACGACAGRGANDCAKCGGRAQFACSDCHGMGTTLVQRQKKVLDAATNKERVEYFQETAPCKTCNQTGKVACDKCAGAGQITCRTCGGRKVVTCQHCQGVGTETCQVCSGQGKTHSIASISCSLKETFDVAVRADPEIARAMKARGGIEQVLELSTSHHATAEANNDTFIRDTQAMTPVTSVVIALADTRTLIRGFGTRQEVLDYRNLAGLLLEGDMAQLESALTGTKAFPPKVTEALPAALGNVLASEANARIALSPSKASDMDAGQEFRGALTGGYATRALAAVRKGLSRAYWAALARGPAAVLALPLLFILVGVVVRDGNMRLGFLLILALATFGAAVGAHSWAVHQLQKQVRPDGAPKLGPIIDRQGLTQTWLIAAGATAAILTAIVAGLIGAAIPAL